MSGHMRKRHTENSNTTVAMYHHGVLYKFPQKIMEKYRVTSEHISADELFADINKKYTKPGALLRGLRVREDLTQVEMAEKIKVTQSDISQMENGVRSIGRTIAKRIEKLFDIDYKIFLE